ncbi:MAG: Fe(2+) transporter permease subunit FeoB [Chromatiales bacterium]
MLTLALAGNPNCGKSALFNALTGVRQTTGNWPGVTVERKEGRFQLDGDPARVIDLPGIYSLDAGSLDERVTRDFLLSREADLIVNVVDATNLERHLYFTVQLLEMGIPIVLALNMIDVARKRGIEVDAERLARELGCPVVPVVAVAQKGLDALRVAMAAVARGERSGGFPLAHDDLVEQATAALGKHLNGAAGANRRWLGLKLLEGDPHAGSRARADALELARRWRRTIGERAGEEADVLIADTRYSHAHALARQVTHQSERGRTPSDRIDRVVLSRSFGIPLFLGVMYLMFTFTINVGGAFVDFFDGVAGALLVDGLGRVLEGWGAPVWVVTVVADGVGGGIQVVATFVPIIACLYIFLSVLEDSGYMARAAFVMDRFMRSIGLPGKAFVPLIVGFGCNVPAVMATRTLDNERERKLTILMNPFMSCGARLPVYALFVTAFFPTNGQNLVFVLYLTGIGVALLTGLVMKRTLLAGESTGFMMELPPYHLPTLKGTSLRTLDRVKLFVKDAGRVIVVMVLALNLLSSVGTDGRFGEPEGGRSVLSALGEAMTPVLAPMGIREENWPATVGIVTGVLAKEVIVGTLDTLYGRMESAGGGAPGPDYTLGQALARAAATVPANLSAVAGRLLDPLGLDLGDVTDPAAAATQHGVSGAVFGAMTRYFDGRAGAFAYLLFILLYAPCAATLGAIVREAGPRWAAFVALWTTGVAFSVATLFYQGATFSRHPESSAAWIAGLALALVAVLAALRAWARRGQSPADRLEAGA